LSFQFERSDNYEAKHMLKTIPSRLVHFLLLASSALLMACGGSQPETTEMQNCSGSRVIRDQQSLELLAGCTRFHGNLSVYKVTSLQPLSRLQSITGDLAIGFRRGDHNPWEEEGTVGVQDLSGLDSLTSISGSLQIERNPQLRSLDGMNNLATLGGNLIIGGGDANPVFGGDADNPLLTEVDALAKLTRINGNLIVTHNPLLENLDGLANVHIVDGDIVIGPVPFFVGNSIGLHSLGLKNLAEVKGNFQIAGDSLLQNLDGLEKLQKVGGILSIYNHSKLTDIDALQNLEAVGGLEIASNDSLGDFEGLDHLQTIHGLGLKISFNQSLTSLAGLGGLTSIKGELTIDSNDRLTSLDGLDSLNELEGGISITGNGSLSDIDALAFVRTIEGNLFIGADVAQDHLKAFNQVEQISGSLIIGFHPSLTDLDWLASIKSLGGLVLTNNETLQSIDALQHLVELRGNLELTSNTNLLNLAALSRVESIGSLIISNSALVSLDDLASLRAIGTIELTDNLYLKDISALHKIQYLDALKIVRNAQLESLNGLDAVETVNGDLFIADNPVLAGLHVFAKLRRVGGFMIIFETPLISLPELQALAAQLVAVDPEAANRLPPYLLVTDPSSP
jgi:hypothetical protein